MSAKLPFVNIQFVTQLCFAITDPAGSKKHYLADLHPYIETGKHRYFCISKNGIIADNFSFFLYSFRQINIPSSSMLIH